jgi:hypothetical protein
MRQDSAAPWGAEAATLPERAELERSGRPTLARRPARELIGGHAPGFPAVHGIETKGAGAAITSKPEARSPKPWMPCGSAALGAHRLLGHPSQGDQHRVHHDGADDDHVHGGRRCAGG